MSIKFLLDNLVVIGATGLGEELFLLNVEGEKLYINYCYARTVKKQKVKKAALHILFFSASIFLMSNF